MQNNIGLSIAALELETGIGKDTLRVWERRYGFPQPSRNDHGERLYPPEQVARLQTIRRLLDQGMRPGQALTLTEAELAEHSRSAVPEDEQSAVVMELLKRHDEAALGLTLRMRVMKEGLQRFVMDSVPPMLSAVGHAWTRGEIEVFEEHLFSEQLRAALHEAIAQLPATGAAPRVLLTTLPGEPHALGLLLAHALLRLEGALCISLGTQTPESQVNAAARAYEADVVALSFSAYFAPGSMRESVQRLRAALPEATELWCGGGTARRLKRPPPGVVVVGSLEEIAGQLGAWRAGHAAACRPGTAPEA